MNCVCLTVRDDDYDDRYLLAFLLAPSFLVNEYGSCAIPETGLGCLAFAEQTGTQDQWGTYVQCPGPFSGQFHFLLPADVTRKTLTEMRLHVNYRASNLLYQRAEWYVKRARDSQWLRLFTTGDMDYIYSWVWDRYDTPALPNPWDYVETEYLNGKLIQRVAFRYVVANGKPEPSTQLDLFLLSVKINYTLPSVCGNSIVEGAEECDSGLSCTSSCTCENGTESTVPISINCTAIVPTVIGEWTEYPQMLKTHYGVLDMSDSGLACLHLKNQSGYQDLFSQYIEMIAPFNGDFEFIMPNDARYELSSLTISINYRSTSMYRQRTTWYIWDWTTGAFVRIFSLYDMPYYISWIWQEHSVVLVSGVDKYVNPVTGKVVIKMFAEMGKPEPAVQLDYFAVTAKRI